MPRTNLKGLANTAGRSADGWFQTGLARLAPIVLVVLVLQLLFGILDGIMGYASRPIVELLPAALHVTVFRYFIDLVIVLVLGALLGLMSKWAPTRKLLEVPGITLRLFLRALPTVNKILQQGQVVCITYGGPGQKTIAFATGETYFNGVRYVNVRLFTILAISFTTIHVPVEDVAVIHGMSVGHGWIALVSGGASLPKNCSTSPWQWTSPAPGDVDARN